MDVTNIRGTGINTDLSADDIDSMPIDVLAFYLAIHQTKALDGQIRTALELIKEKQKTIKECREVMDKLRDIKEKGGGMLPPPDVVAFFKAKGLNLYGGVGEQGKAKLDISIENVKSYMENTNGAVEIDMLQIQSLMNKRNQALEMASNIMKKSDTAKEAISRNI